MPIITGSNYSGSLKTTKDAVGNNVVVGTGGSSAPSKPSGVETTGSASTSSKTSSANTDELNSILNDTNLTPDERKAIESVYKAVSEGDEAAAQKMLANLQLAATFAEPMLQRKLKLITDELTRTVEGMDQDLEYQETGLKNRLADLQNDISYKKDQLSLDLQQELKDLESYFGQKLEQTQIDMASRGMESSSIRNKKESLLADQKGDLVETTNRKFGEQIRNLDTTESRTERDTALELERLKQLTERGKVDLARSAEATLGTTRTEDLNALNGIDTLGGVDGQVDIDYKDELAQFAF